MTSLNRFFFRDLPFSGQATLLHSFTQRCATSPSFLSTSISAASSRQPLWQKSKLTLWCPSPKPTSLYTGQQQLLLTPHKVLNILPILVQSLLTLYQGSSHSAWWQRASALLLSIPLPVPVPSRACSRTYNFSCGYRSRGLLFLLPDTANSIWLHYWISWPAVL